MQPMTPEERFIKIENALAAVAENQARHDTKIAELITHWERQDALIDKHTAAIRDLIVVSRTLVDSQNATFKIIDRLSEKVDRLGDYLRGQGPNGNS